MAAVIAFMIAIGVIFSAEEATPEMIDQYEEEYHQSIVIDDVTIM
jgi:hypothetical protein